MYVYLVAYAAVALITLVALGVATDTLGDYKEDLLVAWGVALAWPLTWLFALVWLCVTWGYTSLWRITFGLIGLGESLRTRYERR